MTYRIIIYFLFLGALQITNQIFNYDYRFNQMLIFCRNLMKRFNFNSTKLSLIANLMFCSFPYSDVKLHQLRVVVIHVISSGAIMLSHYHYIGYAMPKQLNYEFLYLVNMSYF